MRIYSLNRKTIPKVAVLATGLAVALLAATIHPAPAQAEPGFGVTCIGCHTAGGSVSAIPSSATLAPGAAYTVNIVITNAATGNSGYNISLAGASVATGGPSATKTFTANLTAPAAVGSYTYNVGADTDAPPGAASATTFSITVGAVVPPTTPPTTVEPTTPPTTVEPTTPPTTVPPVATGAAITKISPDHANVGKKVTIRGTGFGTPGEVMFGTVSAKVLKWSSTKIVVKVPAQSVNLVSLKTTVTPVWYRHAERVLVTATPEGDAASTGVMFTVGSVGADHKGGHDGHSLRDVPGHRGLFDGGND